MIGQKYTYDIHDYPQKMLEEKTFAGDKLIRRVFRVYQPVVFTSYSDAVFIHNEKDIQKIEMQDGSTRYIYIPAFYLFSIPHPEITIMESLSDF